MAKAEKLKVRLVKSAIGYDRTQKETIRALGLRKLGQSVQLPDNEAVRGMVAKVAHLVDVDDEAT